MYSCSRNSDRDNYSRTIITKNVCSHHFFTDLQPLLAGNVLIDAAYQLPDFRNFEHPILCASYFFEYIFFLEMK